MFWCGFFGDAHTGSRPPAGVLGAVWGPKIREFEVFFFTKKREKGKKRIFFFDTQRTSGAKPGLDLAKSSVDSWVLPRDLPDSVKTGIRHVRRDSMGDPVLTGQAESAFCTV